MKNYIKYIILIIVLLLWIFPCQAEEQTIYQIKEKMNVALMEMDNALQRISEEYYEFRPEYPMGKALLSALEKSKKNAKIIFSFSFSSEINYSELFQLFLSTLEYDTEAFKRFIQFTNSDRIPLSISFPEVPEVSEVLDASRDLELKAELIQKSHKYWVKVTVNTKNKQGEEINNCIVWYAPFFLKEDKRQFDKWSTPTTDRIPAGLWAIWTEKEGKLGVEKRFECGDDGRWKREIDIPSPE